MGVKKKSLIENFKNEECAMIMALKCEKCPKIQNVMCEAKCHSQIMAMLDKKYDGVDYVVFKTFS